MSFDCSGGVHIFILLHFESKYLVHSAKHCVGTFYSFRDISIFIARWRPPLFLIIPFLRFIFCFHTANDLLNIYSVSGTRILLTDSPFCESGTVIVLHLLLCVYSRHKLTEKGHNDQWCVYISTYSPINCRL